MKLFVCTLLLAASCQALAGLYKWVDAEGNINYGEYPPVGSEAQRLDPAAPPPANSTRDMSKIRKGMLQAREDKDNAEAEEKAQAEKQAKTAAYCADLEQRISTYQSSPRIRRENAQGEYEYIGDEQKQQRLQALRDKQQKYCQ